MSNWTEQWDGIVKMLRMKVVRNLNRRLKASSY